MATAVLSQAPDLTIPGRIVSPLDQKTYLFDPSDIFRPEAREIDKFRNYDATTELQSTQTTKPFYKKTFQENPLIKRVFNLYHNQHKYQTVASCKLMRQKYLQFNHGEWDTITALKEINAWIDASDPDIDVPNIYHGYQTAERIRAKYPEEDWLQLTGLIHDLGKVLGAFGLENHYITGDTYPLGCAASDKIVFSDTTFKENADQKNPKYNTKYGMYEPNCGLDNLLMTFGHDEYMYQVLKNHPGCTLPDLGMYVIRFHSFYPWHTSGDYWYLANEQDHERIRWVREFNKFDLYSKSDKLPDVDALEEYYGEIAEKYIPGKVRF